MTLEAFRAKLQDYRRAAGITQKAMAREIGLTPTVLSHKLNESDGLRLTHPEVKAIIKVLAGWGALTAESEVFALLAEMNLKPSAFTGEDWASPPLRDLDRDVSSANTFSNTPNSSPKPSPETRTSRHNLPAPITSLIGRETMIDELRERFLDPAVRLITLAGPGGVGKTRLAIEIGRTLLSLFANGVTFVALAGLNDPSLVPSEIVHALGLRESDYDTPIDAVKQRLSGESHLLILDNFEQLTPVASLISDLLASVPALKILVTSRVVLRIYGEHLYWVTPLSLAPPTSASAQEVAASPAVTLFVARARAARPDFQLTDANASAVASICERLDGIPLALELAAARSRFFSPAAILERLDQGLPFLADRTADLPARQRRLEDTIRWSYDLLDEDEQRLFACVSVFPGGFTVEAAEAVADEDCRDEALDLLASLLDKSLILQREDVSGQVRFTMLSTLREFAAGQLTGDSIVYQRMTRYILALVETAYPELSGGRQAEFLDQLDAEHDNLRAALSYLMAHAPADALGLAANLAYFWQRRGYMTEGRHWLNAALSLVPDESSYRLSRARALTGAGSLAYVQGDHAQARAYLEPALTLYRELHERSGEASVLNTLGNLAWDESALEEAQAHYQGAIAIAFEQGDKRMAANALSNLGSLLWQRDLLDDAERYLLESLSLHRETGNKSGIGIALSNLGNLVLKLEQYDRAWALYTEALALERELGDKQQISSTLLNMGVVAMNRSEYARAVGLYLEALELRRQLGFRWGVGSAAINLGNAYTALGDYGQAIALLNEGLTIMTDIGDQNKIGLAREGLGVALLRLGDTASALEHHRAVLHISRETDDPHGISLSLSCIAAVYSVMGDSPRAAALWGYASTLEAAHVIRQLPADRARFLPELEAAREADPTAFEVAYAAGAALTLDSALRLVEG